MLDLREPAADTAAAIDRSGAAAAPSGDGGALQLLALALLVLALAALFLLFLKPVSLRPEPGPPRLVFPYNGTHQLVPESPTPPPPAPAPAAAPESPWTGSTFGIAPPAARAQQREVAVAAAPAGAAPVRAIASTRGAPAGPPPALGPAFSDRSRWEWVEMWSRPGEFLLRRTWLGSPERLARGLGRSHDVDRFLERPLVRSVLASPATVSLLLGNQALVGAFVRSPAMRDPAAVQALLSSRLAEQVLASPGVQAMFKDQEALVKVFGNPELVAWLRANPAAAERLGAPAPRAPRRR